MDFCPWCQWGSGNPWARCTHACNVSCAAGTSSLWAPRWSRIHDKQPDKAVTHHVSLHGWYLTISTMKLVLKIDSVHDHLMVVFSIPGWVKAQKYLFYFGIILWHPRHVNNTSTTCVIQYLHNLTKPHSSITPRGWDFSSMLVSISGITLIQDRDARWLMVPHFFSLSISV